MNLIKVFFIEILHLKGTCLEKLKAFPFFFVEEGGGASLFSESDQNEKRKLVRFGNIDTFFRTIVWIDAVLPRRIVGLRFHEEE